MENAARGLKLWSAAEFLLTDQAEFGTAWRYELVDGQIIGHAAPTPQHAAILAGLTTALGNRLRGNTDGCRPEAGSGAAPIDQQSATACIPDVTIRCGNLPRVVFEVISPSELTKWQARDRKRKDLQAVDGVMEIVEIYQAELAVHVYRRTPTNEWIFAALGGADALLDLTSVGLTLPLAEIYEFAAVGGT